MPTASDILSRIQPSSDSILDENRLSISEDLRTITIPAGQDIIGVEEDKDVRRIWFDLPEECDGTDLSDFTPYVNYVNAQDDMGFYIADDLTQGDGCLYFSWLVSGRVCASAGTVKFSVSLKKIDQEDVVQNEFNTTVVTMRVLPGLNATGSEVVERYIDSISEAVREAVNRTVAGSNFMNIGTQVATYNDLPQQGRMVGDVRNVVATGRNYVWTGTVWDDLGGIDIVTVNTATNAQIDALFDN